MYSHIYIVNHLILSYVCASVKKDQHKIRKEVIMLCLISVIERWRGLMVRALGL